MKKIYYNKLVRDFIKKKIENKGEACEIRVIADDAEYEQELLKKIVEEARALAHAHTRDEFLSEYADLMVVLDALAAKLELSPADIALALSENIERKGLYKERHFMHWSSDGDYKSNETPQGLR